jgi:nitric oxide dioxygenase
MDKPEWSDKFDTHHFELFTNDHLINGNWRLMAVLPKADLTASLNYRVVVNWGLISFFSFSIMGLLLMLVLHHFFSKKEISPSDILLVQSSWHNISDQADQVAERFYKELFMLAPQLRQLFRSDVQEQKKSLSIMLNYIVNGIDRIDDLKKTSLIPLAKRHVGYGVQDEHFKLVIQAIINSVAHSSGGSFSQKHYQAWYKVLRHISDVMIREMDSG